MLPEPIAARLALTIGRGLEHSVAAEARGLGLTEPDPGEPVTDADLADMPEPAQRFLRWSGVVGRPRDRSLRARLVGRFRRGPDAAWMRCEAWQFNAIDPVTRLYHMRIDFAGFLPMVGRDVYVHGEGRMVGKLAGLVTVADGSGAPFDIGELTTFVNDAVLLAPSMLLGPVTTWTEVDHESFAVAFSDAGRTVEAVVRVDADGAARDFTTRDRYFDGPDGPVRTVWRTPVDGWRREGDRWLPTHCQAVWQTGDGPLPYVDGTFETVAWNVGP